MRKGRDGEKWERKKKREKKENTDENSGHYVIASSRPPERRPLERRTLAPKSYLARHQINSQRCCDKLYLYKVNVCNFKEDQYFC